MTPFASADVLGNPMPGQTQEEIAAELPPLRTKPRRGGLTLRSALFGTGVLFIACAVLLSFAAIYAIDNHGQPLAILLVAIISLSQSLLMFALHHLIGAKGICEKCQQRAER